MVTRQPGLNSYEKWEEFLPLSFYLGQKVACLCWFPVYFSILLFNTHILCAS